MRSARLIATAEPNPMFAGLFCEIAELQLGDRWRSGLMEVHAHRTYSARLKIVIVIAHIAGRKGFPLFTNGTEQNGWRWLNDRYRRRTY